MNAQTEQNQETSRQQVTLKPIVRPELLQARAEVLKIVLSLDPEEQLNEYVKSSECGSTGEYDSYWDEEKLMSLFEVDGSHKESPLTKTMDSLEAMYWDLLARRDEAKWVEDSATELAKEILRDGTAKTCEHSALWRLQMMLGVEV